MGKNFLLRLTPLVLLAASNFLLWLLLRDGSGAHEDGQRTVVYHYFVMYVVYFSLFVSVFCIASAAIRSLLGDGKIARLISFFFLLPSAVLALGAGLLGFAVAFNGLVLALIPAVLYFLTLGLFVWTEFFLGRRLTVRH